MEGELLVESEYGKGSYFHFMIPQKVCGNEIIGEFEKRYGVSLIGKGVSGQSFTASSARILVVDDDKMNRAVMKGLLKRTLVQADFADSGEGCLTELSKAQYDIILLDHMMPGMDGIETLAEMKKRYPDNQAKVIVLTANAISGAKQMYMASGFDDYLTKPVDGDTLEKTLLKYLPEEKIDWTVSGSAAGHAAEAVFVPGTDHISGIVSVPEAAPASETASVSGMESAAREHKVSLGELKEWKAAVPDLDVLLGLQYSIEDRDFYFEMLRMFTEQSKIPELDRYYEGAEWDKYHNLVHALKSNTLSIGLVRLSEEARQLEYAAKRKDYGYISSCHKEVMEYYEECIHKLRNSFLNKRD